MLLRRKRFFLLVAMLFTIFIGVAQGHTEIELSRSRRIDPRQTIEKNLSKVFRTPFLLTLAGIKPISWLEEDIFNPFEIARLLHAGFNVGTLENQNIGWFTSKNGPRKVIVFYNKLSIVRLIQKREVRLFLLNSGYDGTFTLAEIVPYLEKIMALNLHPATSTNTQNLINAILGIFLGYPYKDALEFKRQRELGNDDTGIPVPILKNHPGFLGAGFTTFGDPSREETKWIQSQSSLAYEKFQLLISRGLSHTELFNRWDDPKLAACSAL